VDVGGKRKRFDVAVIDEERLVALRDHVDVAGVLDLVVVYEPRLVAIDSPRCFAAEGQTSRDGERRLARNVCGIRWTPDEQHAQGAYYEWIHEGLALYEALAAARGIDFIEVFPTASWTRWLGPRGSQTRGNWTRTGLSDLGLSGLPGRTNQDQRDAIVAAVTGREHTRGHTDAYGEIIIPRDRDQAAQPGEGRCFAQSVKRALLASAGLLQATIAAAPYPSELPEERVVREGDLQIAFARSLQAQVGARVQRELPVTGRIPLLTKGRYGAVEAAILDRHLKEPVALVETKWCIEDKLVEVLWDSIKLAQLLNTNAGVECFLVYGAPDKLWESRTGNPLELFDTGEHNTAALLDKHTKAWQALLRGGGARPKTLPASFRTAKGPSVPIHLHAHRGWMLRVAQILPSADKRTIAMGEHGWPST
jgi:predicted nuclease with RNAse H fold